MRSNIHTQIKSCSKCPTEGPAQDHFPKHSANSYRSVCHNCYSTQNKARYRKKTPEVKTLHRLSKVDIDRLTGMCSVCGPVNVRVFHDTRDNKLRYACKKKDAELNRKASLRRRGLTLEDFEAMLHAQNHRCAICERENPNKHPFHVDHCHRTGKVRSLLCGQCNIALGHVDDNTDTLLRMISYLDEHST